MDTLRIGQTDMVVNKNGFGALPIQRISEADAVSLLRKAYDNGINFFDTARFYTDSECKLGAALSGVRSKIFIASKTGATNPQAFWNDLHTTLTNLKTDYLDLYQFHNPDFCPRPGDESGIYDAMLEAQRQGKVRYIGISNHRLSIAKEAIESGLFQTLQFPFSYLASDLDMEVMELCGKKGMGFICMKAMSGGLITDSALAYAYLNQFAHVLPIWGIQRENELDEFISYQNNPPRLNEQMLKKIEEEKKVLAGDFCRGCGYCMPCPQGIEISDCARMSLFLRRAPLSVYLTAEWAGKMKQIEKCKHCGRCKSKCPYGLDTPSLLERNYEDFKTFWKY